VGDDGGRDENGERSKHIDERRNEEDGCCVFTLLPLL